MENGKWRREAATARVAATSFPRIAVAAGLVPALTIITPE